MLADLDAGRRRVHRDPAHEPGGLQHAVGRMEQRRRVAVDRRGEVLTPLRSKAGVAQRLIFLT